MGCAGLVERCARPFAVSALDSLLAPRKAEEGVVEIEMLRVGESVQKKRG